MAKKIRFVESSTSYQVDAKFDGKWSDIAYFDDKKQAELFAANVAKKDKVETRVSIKK